MLYAAAATERCCRALAATNSWEEFPILARTWPILSCSLSSSASPNSSRPGAWSNGDPGFIFSGNPQSIALPCSLGQYLVKEAKVESWIRKDFAKRTRLAIRQTDVDEHFGLWLPTRRGYIGGVHLMACKLAKFTPPVSALEEARYPYLDQNLIEFILSIPASQLLRPGKDVR